MVHLATALRGQSLLIHRVKDLLYGESFEIRVEVDAEFEPGSLVIPVHVLFESLRGAETALLGGLKSAESILISPAVTALANLAGLLGFGFGINLYSLFTQRKGRKIESPDELPPEIKINIPLADLIRIYNDLEVQSQLRRTIHPLRQDGIEEFQTRRNGAVIQSVFKPDLQAADEAELEDIVKDEEVVLDIEKAAWRRSLAWHFSDGSTSFDAKIEHDAFWERIERGEAFSVGDRLKVHLRTTAHRTDDGRLRVQRVIPEVLEVDHVRRKQKDLFEEDRSN